LFFDVVVNVLRCQRSAADSKHDLVRANFTPWEFADVARGLVEKQVAITREWDVYVVDQAPHLPNMPREGRVRHRIRRDLAIVLSARDGGPVNLGDFVRAVLLDKIGHPVIDWLGKNLVSTHVLDALEGKLLLPVDKISHIQFAGVRHRTIPSCPLQAVES
jgi:hypothetical protein